MSKVVFIGCSTTAGQGLDKKFPERQAEDSSELYVNLCHTNIDQLKDLELLNLSVSGFSNTDIFIRAVDTITKHHDIEYLICSWTSMPRYNFEVGFELYQTNATSAPNGRMISYNLNNGIVLSSSFLNDICDKFRALHHIQFEIVRLLEYINILKRLTNDKIKFINVNHFCPWDENFFEVKEVFQPIELTEFTKSQILNVEYRNDEEIMALYKKQHQQYADVGGIQTTSWANLYNGFCNHYIDVAYDNVHPGINSHYKFYTIVSNYFANIAV